MNKRSVKPPNPLTIGTIGVAGGVALMADRDRTVLTVIGHGLAVESREHVAVGVIGEAMRAHLGWRMRVGGGCVLPIYKGNFLKSGEFSRFGI